MSTISRLPDSTTRLLGSPITITTPVTLVKELLDNSIDAKATSIEVIISANTVKKIEVRDNGTGIHPDDYDALGRRGHTSKLRSFEELRTRYGKTLGFRGEALASANSLAQVTVTTRIASEPVAVTLHLLPGIGGVAKQKPASAPVGTTVSITGLFSQLPVREQVAVKDSAKTIDQIRELLRSYAMARPQLRLSFRILQSPKPNWSYSPKQGDTVREATIQLFGAELAACCVEKTFQSDGLIDTSEPTSSEHQDPLPPNHYLFEAFIQKPGSSLFKAPKHRYFSIDGRPISAKGHTVKKILSIYVEHISVAFRQHHSTVAPKDCFIRLNIKCPPGSYDVNIEPSKDNVLFSDEKVILDGFKYLCETVYKAPLAEEPNLSPEAEPNPILSNDDNQGVPETRALRAPVESQSPRVPSHIAVAQTQDPAILESIPIAESQEQQEIPNHQSPVAKLQETDRSTSTGLTPINKQSTPARNESPGTEPISLEDISNAGCAQWKIDMSRDFNEQIHGHPIEKRSRPIHTLSDLQERPSIVQYSTPQDVNPWIIAKMSAPSRNMEEGTTSEIGYENCPPLPIPEPPMTPDPPILRHARAAPRDLDVPPTQRRLYPQSDTNQLNPIVPRVPYRSPISSPVAATSQKAMASTPPHTAAKLRHRRNYLPWSPPSSIKRAKICEERLDNPEHDLNSDCMKQTTISFKNVRRNRGNRRLQENGGVIQEDLQDLIIQEPLDESEVQQMSATARRSLNYQLSRQNGFSTPQRQSYRASTQQEIYQGQPHTQLRVVDTQGEGPLTEIKVPIKTTLPGGDPRAYLLRRQKSAAAEESSIKPIKIRRLKSSLLPLENIPSDGQNHSLVLFKVVSIEALDISVKQGARFDSYVAKGTISNGLEMDLAEGCKIEERLKLLLCTKNGVVDGEEFGPEINLCSLLKGKGIAIDV
ncbi:hypothetical protein AAE478_000720 [Parahypoxylon ruwenzoriense]